MNKDLSIISVTGLRQLNYKIKVHHSRRYYRYEGMGKVEIDLLPNSVADVSFALPCGGKTEVVVVDPNGVEFMGVARCCDKDAYCKRIGVQLALTDAIRKLLISKTKKTSKLISGAEK